MKRASVFYSNTEPKSSYICSTPIQITFTSDGCYDTPLFVSQSLIGITGADLIKSRQFEFGSADKCVLDDNSIAIYRDCSSAKTALHVDSIVLSDKSLTIEYSKTESDGSTPIIRSVDTCVCVSETSDGTEHCSNNFWVGFYCDESLVEPSIQNHYYFDNDIVVGDNRQTYDTSLAVNEFTESDEYPWNLCLKGVENAQADDGPDAVNTAQPDVFMTTGAKLYRECPSNLVAEADANYEIKNVNGPPSSMHIVLNSNGDWEEFTRTDYCVCLSASSNFANTPPDKICS
jgi:hypothetical protein